MRSEQDILHELANLCTSPGYVHAIAYLCYRDNTVSYAGEMTVEDMSPMFSPNRLIRTELSTLIGLLIKTQITYDPPSPAQLQQYIDRTYGLLEELHKAIAEQSFPKITLEQIAPGDPSPFGRGEALREPIFYCGESAYAFQYLDLAQRKYSADDEWLKTKKGFSIRAARKIFSELAKFLDTKLTATFHAYLHTPPEKWEILPSFTFSLYDATQLSGIDKREVERVLNSFSISDGERNDGFRTLHDLNAANATPLLRKGRDEYIWLVRYSLCEALYESPFYWMVSDMSYVNVAMAHRGNFAEDFSRERLELVFGKSNVYSGASIHKSKGKKAGEIDTLVLFGNRAIILQAKSKRLTLEARRGNDGRIKEDFQRSVQDSYDQALKCASLLCDPNLRLVDTDSRKIVVPRQIKEIYILCVVSDAYPALNFQAQELLKFQTTSTIRPPLITDIFTIDAMTEMLYSPLHFLSYLNKRTKYHGRIFARDEMTILSFHLKRNLWIDDEYQLTLLGDEFAADLDVAMTVRREGAAGRRTPQGILTRAEGTIIARMLKEIEATPDPRTIELGFMLLKLSEHAVFRISEAIEDIARRARDDGRSHDVTVPIDEGGTGLTIHCNNDPVPTASRRLRRHCEARKYIHKGNTWFGICVTPDDASVRFGINLDYQWEKDEKMDEMVENLPKAKDPINHPLLARPKKIGRNDPCPCGSGKKYKRCCLKG